VCGPRHHLNTWSEDLSENRSIAKLVREGRGGHPRSELSPTNTVRDSFEGAGNSGLIIGLCGTCGRPRSWARAGSASAPRQSERFPRSFRASLGQRHDGDGDVAALKQLEGDTAEA
jgi:hypothetical protein